MLLQGSVIGLYLFILYKQFLSIDLGYRPVTHQLNIDETQVYVSKWTGDIQNVGNVL